MNEKIKIHWEKYKQTYITVGVGVVVGVVVGVGVYVLTRQKTPNIKVDMSVGNDNHDPQQMVNLGTLNYTVEADRQGPPSWVVRCLETGEVFSSQSKAAEALNVSPNDISKTLNGLRDNAGGLHFERICMAA
jgi:hypothetical protein